MSAPGVAGQAINVACGGRISLNDVIEILSELVGREIEPEYLPPRAGDVPFFETGERKAMKRQRELQKQQVQREKDAQRRERSARKKDAKQGGTDYSDKSAPFDYFSPQNPANASR